MTEEEAIKMAVRIVLGASLDLIQADPHQWSERPCSTCSAVTAITGQNFGCVRYARLRQAARAGGVNQS
jgi:hypothetical protein